MHARESNPSLVLASSRQHNASYSFEDPVHRRGARHGAAHAVLVFLSRDGVWLGLGFRALYHMSLPEGTAQVRPSVRNVVDSRINIVGEIVALGASRLAPDSKEGRPWT